jgi:hypothetical protein
MSVGFAELSMPYLTQRMRPCYLNGHRPDHCQGIKVTFSLSLSNEVYMSGVRLSTLSCVMCSLS